MLEALGLTPAESVTYAALVNNPRSNLVELAEHAALSASQTAQAAQTLVRRGLANRLPGAEVHYVAVAPDIALEPLIAEREDQLRRTRECSRELSAAFRESSRHTHPAELMEIITGADNIAHRMHQLHDTARVQVRGFDRPPYSSVPGTDNIEGKRLKEGVTYKVIYTPESLTQWPGRIQTDIRSMCAQGEIARVRPDLPLKLVLVDDRLALVPVKTSLHRIEAALVIHPCALFDALAALFESEWRQAIELRTYLASGDRFSAGPQDANSSAVLTGLVAGLTDDSIARSLGWSLRTTQRHIQRLMHELNASSRFQAGIQARERGWA